MKRIFVVILSVLLMFSGCDSYRALMSVESSTPKSWEQRHGMLDGKKSHTLYLGTEIQEMEVKIVTEKGEIDVTVEDSLGKTVFEIENAKTGTYYFSAEGRTKITVEADEHKGSIAVKRRES